jgi:hypothetical protein
MITPTESPRATQPARYCVKCGARAAPEWRFCRSCGRELPPAAVGSAAAAAPMPASASRRTAAGILDVLLLIGSFVLALSTAVAIAPSAALLGGLVAVWVLLLGPLYFALYHAFGGPEGGPGSTPGQHELRLDIRDASGGRPPLRTTLVRSYAGLAEGLLVVPLAVECLRAAGNDQRRSWRDRRWGTEVWHTPATTPRFPPTSPKAARLLSDEHPRATHLLGRAWALVKHHGRPLIGSTLLVYAAFGLLAGVFVPISLGDTSSSGDVGTWLGFAIALFTSGIYWTQATVVAAVESIRRDVPAGPVEHIRGAAEHVNALSAALVLLLLMLYPLASMVWLVFPVLLLARFALVVPVLMLEDRRVLESLGRSWSLTEGRTWRVAGLALVSIAALAIVIALGSLIGIGVTAGLSQSGGMGDALAMTAALVIASVPVSAVIAWLGTAWCLLYYDLRAEARY